LPGKWKTKNVKSSSPDILEFAASGPDGLTLRSVDYQATCDARFDGKDYPLTGGAAGVSEKYTAVYDRQ
jgi:hypothetical protein